MAVSRNTNLPQHSYGSGAHYGELPLAALPAGSTTGDIFYYSGSGWMITPINGVVSGGGSGASDSEIARHAVHGTFLATYHRASDEIPLVLYSDDGITFRDGAAIHTALRDPSIMHWDGKFWATCTNSATAIVVFSSTDLETWTQIATPTTDGSATQSWAPEWVRNVDGTPYLHPSTGLPCLTVNVSTDSETTFTVREMHPTNRAMTSWSSTTAITGTGLPSAMIDGFLMADTDSFYLWFKDEANKHIEIAESSALTSGYTLLESGDWAGWFAAKDAGANSIEGPCVIRLDDGRWRVYFNENDGLDSIRAVYSETTDDWRTGTSTWTTQASLTTDALMSHGSVIFIPSVYDHQRDEAAHAALLASKADATDLPTRAGQLTTAYMPLTSWLAGELTFVLDDNDGLIPTEVPI